MNLPDQHFDFDANCEKVLTLFAGEQTSQTRDYDYGGECVKVTTSKGAMAGGNWCVVFSLEWQDPKIYESLVAAIAALEQIYPPTFELIQEHKNQIESLKGHEVSATDFARHMTGVAMIELEPRGRNECHATLRFVPDRRKPQIASALKDWREMVYGQSQDNIVSGIWRNTLAEWQKQPTEKDKLPDLPSTAPRQDAGLVLEKKGEGWVITYRGSDSLILRDSKGIAAIALLLQKPNKDFSAIELAQAIEKNGATNAVWSASEIAEASLSISGFDGGGKVLDSKAKREYRAKLEELTEKKGIATASGDYVKAEECEREHDSILAELNRTSGLGGNSREFAGQTENARAAITQRIRGTIRKIKSKNAMLSGYLETTIETGQYCVYRPERAEQLSVTVKP
ncbi:MAG: hypothetical protein HY741_14050 [Chloroflexi bacterium]|nr:hypothetical protein [Chloroflexota bacterium]